MIAGEIGFRVVGGYPGLMLCDGVYTVWAQFQNHATWAPGTQPAWTPANGEILIAGHTTNGTFDYNQVVLAYGGIWWNTVGAWINDAGAAMGPLLIHEARIVPSSYVSAHWSGSHAFPSLVVRDGSSGHWWCDDYTGITFY